MQLSLPVRDRLPAGPSVPPSAVGGDRRRSWRVLAAVGSGLVGYLAFPPAGLWPLAPVAVALLVLAVRGASVRAGLGLGLLHGLALFLPLVEWTATLAGLPALVALALLQAAFFAALGAALALVTRAPGWPVAVAALWVLQEAARGRAPFGGFTWGRLAFSQAESPLLPLAALGGAPLLTAAVALLGGLLAWAAVWAERRTWPGERVLAVAVAGALAVPLVAVAVPAAEGGQPVRVALVQGNVPRLGLDFNAQRSAVLRNHVEATRRLAADVRAGRILPPDLVVWPENASDVDPLSDEQAFAEIDGAVKDVGVPCSSGRCCRGRAPRCATPASSGTPRPAPVRPTSSASSCPSGSTSRCAPGQRRHRPGLAGPARLRGGRGARRPRRRTGQGG
jgi:apolipoprotein N-acyltransferase